MPLAFSLFKVLQCGLFPLNLLDQTIEYDQVPCLENMIDIRSKDVIDIHSAVLSWESTCVFVSSRNEAICQTKYGNEKVYLVEESGEEVLCD